MKIEIFGLLHLEEGQQTTQNLSTRDFNEHVLIYLNNAITLSKSLSPQGITFNLLTNNNAIIDSFISVVPNALPDRVIEIPCITKVPSGTRFYSAHYKLDALRYLASLDSGYFVLCDLDMVCLNNFPTCLRNLIQAGIPLFYDISDQVIPAYGHDTIIRDLSIISGLESEGRWSGGEFIAGTPEFFNKLVKQIDIIYDNYISNISSLHHVGDEAFTSAALEKLRRDGVYIADAGPLCIVGRYWNTSVLHHQKTFDYFTNCFLLHLPADKRFLSDLSQKNAMTLSQFKVLYEKQQRSFLTKMKKASKVAIHHLKKKTNEALQLTALRRR